MSVISWDLQVDFLIDWREVAGEAGTEFLAWLGDSVDQANQAASDHEALKAEIRALKEILEDTFLLRAVHVSPASKAISLLSCSSFADEGDVSAFAWGCGKSIAHL